jgi:hypothetical protein
MDILAPVFAYIACVAGIVGAFVVSFSLVFSAPNGSAISQHSAAVVSATSAKSDMLADGAKPALKPALSDNSAINRVAEATQKREVTLPTKTPPRTVVAAAPRPVTPAPNPKSKITRAQWREMVAQERSRRLAFQQNSDFESRFLGFAD